MEETNSIAKLNFLSVGEDSEAHLHLITDALPVLISYIDKNRIYRFNNKAYQTWFGHSSKEISGNHMKDVLGEVAYENLKPKIDQVLSGKPVQFEMQVPYKDGGTRWIVADYIPHFDKENEVLGYYAVVNDVTVLKKAEELNANLASIVQSSTDAIISKTLEGIITSWNPGAEKIFGYTATEMIGEPISRIIPQDRLNEEPFIINQISHEIIVDHFETRRLTKSGKFIDISLTISPIKNSEGKIVGASKIARDITSAKIAEEIIKQNAKQQAFLLKISDAMRPLNNPLDIEDAVTKIALDYMEADRCHYSIIEEDNVVILQDASRGDLPSVSGVHSISSFPLYQTVLNEGSAFVIDDAHTTNILDEGLKKMCLQFGYVSFINVPVIKNGKTKGLFSLVQSNPRKWTDEEVQLCIEIAERIWAAVERANAEEKVKASEKKFEAAILAVEGIIWTTNAIGEMEGEQSGWAELTGQNFEEYQGFGWAKAAHPDEAQPTVHAWNEAVKNKITFEFEHRLKTKQDGWRIFSVKAVPVFDENGAIQQWVGVHTDITEQREAAQEILEREKQFSTLANNIQSLAWIADGEGRIYWYNKRWYDYTGTSLEEMQGSGWEKLLHPDHIDRVVDFVKVAWKINKPWELIYPMRGCDGLYRTFLTRANPIYNEKGKITNWIGTNTDIEQQKQNEDRKDEFISIASHELKTPLTTAKAYLQMLELSLDESQEDANLYTKKASQSVDRLNELISELLDVSKMRLGKLNYSKSYFNFNDMVDRTVEDIQLIAPSHTIIKTGKVSSDVLGDKDRLQQVVINLLTNAIKYSPGTEKIFLHIEQENHMLKVSVKDYGIGIGKQSLHKIFDKYHRIEEHAIHFQGLGIGLHISYEIIQRHQGKLWAESEPGKGSIFYFTIPVSNVESKIGK